MNGRSILVTMLLLQACAPSAPVVAPTAGASQGSQSGPSGQTGASSGSASNASSPAAGTSREDACLRAARACGDAFAVHDYGRLVDCMPPEVFDAFPGMGGREGFRATAERAVQKMASEGASVESVEYSRPHALAGAGGKLFAIVPEVLTMKIPQGHLVSHDFMLGVSHDGGATWKFIAGPFAKKATPRLFPDFPADLELPEIPKPELGP